MSTPENEPIISPLPEAEFIHLDADMASAQLCLNELSYFVKEFWDEIVPNPLVWNWHMDVLCNEIQAVDERVFLRQEKLHDLIINVPPGTSKTKIVSVMATAWEFARMPGIKVFVGSYSDSAVSGIADDIRLLMKSVKYRTYFPKTAVRKDKDSLHNFKTTSNGEFYAFTIGGTITSKHADILKVDDPMNPKMAASAAEIVSTNHFFDKTLPSRKVDKAVTPTMLVMQRLSTQDPTGHLLEKKPDDIRHVCLPATLSNNVKPAEYKKFYINGYLDPLRLGEKVVREARLDLGSDGFAGQYDQQPVPEGGLIWKQWFKVIPDLHFPARRLMSDYGTDWDLAYTSDDDNAATAYVTGGKIGNKYYIDDLSWEWFEFPQMIRWMKTKPAPHYIEAKASGKSAKQTLSKQGVVAIEVKVDGGSDKVARAKMVTPIAEAGMVYIRQSLVDKLYNDSKQGILLFPKSQWKDLADALAQFLYRIHGDSKIIIGDDRDEDQFYDDDDMQWIEDL